MSTYNLQRFRDEVTGLQAIGDHPGVLSLVATNALDTPTPRAVWLATRVAEGVRLALGREVELATVVGLVHDYAETFRDLADQEIHHRDIKPENLFRLDGAWVVGDFGLVDYPGKTDITAPDRRLGPLFYRAPEMLRNPDTADPGPADVYSLAKTLWALASDQNFPPDGQIMPDVEMHSLSYWLAGQGSVALQLILMNATADDPADRPTMAQFVEQLNEWSAAKPRREDQAARSLHQEYVRRLGESLSSSLDLDALEELEATTTATFQAARQSIGQNTREVQRAAAEEAKTSKVAFLRERGMKGALHIHDNVWIGPLRDGDDVVAAVTAQPVDQRDADLFRGWQVLMGRPLLWMHSVALIGTLQLRGMEGCEPRATEIARQGIRNHLLGFPDDGRFASAWRLQRALIQATVRVLGFAPLEAQVKQVKEQLPVEAQVLYRPSAGQIMMNLTTTVVSQRLREVEWTPAALSRAAGEAEAALAAIPIPPTRWEGPGADPWLASWAGTDPLIQCGVGILAHFDDGDDVLRNDPGALGVIRALSESAGPIERGRAAAILARLNQL
ncbi:MAG: protein kinase domain-containing protein [Solirubrobacteraceae bacterium]